MFSSSQHANEFIALEVNNSQSLLCGQKKEVNIWKTTSFTHRLLSVSSVAISGSDPDIFSLCLKREESGEMPGAIVSLITRQAQS